MPTTYTAHLRDDGLYDVGATTHHEGRSSSNWFVASEADLEKRGLKLRQNLTAVDESCELEETHSPVP